MGLGAVSTVTCGRTLLADEDLPGDPWHTQDLAGALRGRSTGTSPVAIVHDGYTSVYYIDAGTGAPGWTEAT